MDTPIAPIVQVKGILRPCCADPQNLQTLKPSSPEHRAGMIVRQCRRCGRRHFEMIVDPGRFGVTGSRM